MRLSRLFGKTLRQAPAEAETASHQLLLRAAMIDQVAAGVYTYLPLAWRTLRKIEQIIREEMDAAGGQEIMMPVLQPLELWEESGRAVAFGETLFTLRDRRQRRLCLGATHEEVITQLVRHHVRSYRDLPLILYQIQTKLRDEPRPRGGLIRVREFTMKDAYSFDADEAGLDDSYRRMIQAYKNIYRRCGLTTVMVEADSGAIGGKDSHEFTVITPTGEDEVIYCSSCEYAANQERATFAKPNFDGGEMRPVAEVSTPGITTIADLAQFLGIGKAQTLKAVFYAADGQVVFVNIRGDLDINEVKLKNLLRCNELRLATEAEVATAGLVAGYASPVGASGIRRVGDDSVLLGANFVAGANRPNYHLAGVNYPRDFALDTIADIALAQGCYACPRCGAALLATRGIEVGHVFKLGTVFSRRFGAEFLDRDGVQRPLVMGCYGTGTGRLMAAAIEQNHDERGIIWPPSIAPYHIYLCALSMGEAEVSQAAEALYEGLTARGLEVLYDDRTESPGVKFNDADLLGLPIRVTVSPRTLRSQSAEVKRRHESAMELVPLSAVTERLRAMLEAEHG